MAEVKNAARNGARRAMPHIDSTNVVDRIVQQKEDQAERSVSFALKLLFMTYLPLDQQVKFRFQGDINTGLTVKTHSKYVPGNPTEGYQNVPCWEANYGIDCPMCADALFDSSIKEQEAFCWQIWRFPTDKELTSGMSASGRMGFLFMPYWASNTVGQLFSLYNDPEQCDKTLLGYDFTATCEKQNGKNVWKTNIGKRIEAVDTSRVRLAPKKKMLELIAQAFAPDLYKEIKDDPDCVSNDEYWVVNRGQQDVRSNLTTAKKAPRPNIGEAPRKPKPRIQEPEPEFDEDEEFNFDADTFAEEMQDE